jgi:glycosyltransferase involved in cell wall biosynthesis
VKALKLYHQKYGKILKATLITGILDKKYNADEKQILELLENEVGGKEELEKYLEILGRVSHGEELDRYYTRSRLVALTSIYEGKNRTINEALCCNTPVVVFKDLSKYTRGDDDAFPENAGIYVPEFSPESFCDTMHEALNNLDKFTPRRSYLKFNGRMNFLNKCIDSIPYYRENLPEYVPGRAQDNLWLDLAMQENYQLSLNAFLYGANPAIHHVKLHENDTGIMDFFNARFMIHGGEKILPNKGNDNA